MKKRLVLSLVLIILISGCVGVDSYQADKPTIDEDTLDQEKYVLEGNQSFLVNNTIEFLGSEGGIEVKSYMNTYSKSSSDLTINFSKDSIKDFNITKILIQSNLSVIDVLGENRTINIITNNSDIEEDSIRLFLNNGGSIDNYIEENNINITEYINKQELYNSLNQEQKSQIISEFNAYDIGSIFSVISTRSAGVLGTELNPFMLGTSEELINQVNNRTKNSINITSFEESFEIKNNKTNSTITADLFKANITLENEIKFDSNIIVSRKRIGDDILVMVGIYPSFADEKRSISKLIEKSSIKK
jgi:PBP1b-binding outer membrane lipoprotein LpoB